MTIREMPLDRNGHLTSPRGDTVEVQFAPPEVYAMAGLEWMKDPYLLTHIYDCAMCGEVVETEILADEVRITTPCPLPEGITTEITIDVPSGKLVVTDDLRPVFNGFRDDFASYNTAKGQAQVTEEYAKQGCAYGPVGNSCPTLYRTGEDTYVIANPAYDPDTDTETVPDGWEKLAWVCTDLWAYSIADHDLWAARGGNSPDVSFTGQVIEIPAGRYTFTHHTGEKSFDRDAEGVIVYADIRREAE